MLDVFDDLKFSWKYDKVLIITAILIAFSVLGIVAEGAFLVRTFREISWCQEQAVTTDAMLKAAYREIASIRKHTAGKYTFENITAAVVELNERSQAALILAGRNVDDINAIDDCFKGLVQVFEKFKADVEGVIQAEAIRHVAIDQKLDNLNYRLRMLEKMIPDEVEYNKGKGKE